MKNICENDKLHTEKEGVCMSDTKLTQAEATALLEMVKRSLITEIDFPTRGNHVDFDVIGDTKQDIFAINIYRGKIQPRKYNLSARIKKKGILLLELHINPTTVHQNPDGEKIKGSHWHIYNEEYGRAVAFPADDIEADKFVENTIDFLIKFNVIERPNIFYQEELA